mmetsp:Transcript_39696/g.74038  ORF Transcript_39696/g.74038 Transcript_39696/m.74038 type:complete len:223 (-) Transcript_39696:1978-2646(-)
MLHQGFHARQQVLHVSTGLGGEPLVNDVRVTLCVGKELLHCVFGLLALRHGAKAAEGSEFVGHSFCRGEVFSTELRCSCITCSAEVPEQNIPEPSLARAWTVHNVRLIVFQRQFRVALSHFSIQLFSYDIPDAISGRVELCRVNRWLCNLHQGRLGGEDEGVRKQGQVFRDPVCKSVFHGIHEGSIWLEGLQIVSRQGIQHRLGAEPLGGLPTIEGVCVEAS